MINLGALNPLLIPEQLLLDTYFRAFKLYSEAKTIMSFEGQGTKFDYLFTDKNPAEVMEVCNYCLRQQNPSKYGYITSTKKVIRI